MGRVPCQGHERDLNILVACHIESQNISIWKASRRIIESSSLPKVISEESWIITCEGTKLRADSPESAYVRRKGKKNPAKHIFALPWMIQTMQRSCQIFHMADATRGFDCLEKDQCYDQACKTCVWSEQFESTCGSQKQTSLYQVGTGLQRGCHHPCPPGILSWQPLAGRDVKLKKEKHSFWQWEHNLSSHGPGGAVLLKVVKGSFFKKKRGGIFKPADSDRARGVVLN